MSWTVYLGNGMLGSQLKISEATLGLILKLSKVNWKMKLVICQAVHLGCHYRCSHTHAHTHTGLYMHRSLRKYTRTDFSFSPWKGKCEVGEREKKEGSFLLSMLWNSLKLMCVPVSPCEIKYVH